MRNKINMEDKLSRNILNEVRLIVNEYRDVVTDKELMEMIINGLLIASSISIGGLLKSLQQQDMKAELRKSITKSFTEMLKNVATD